MAEGAFLSFSLYKDRPFRGALLCRCVFLRGCVEVVAASSMVHLWVRFLRMNDVVVPMESFSERLASVAEPQSTDSMTMVL